MKSWKTTAAGLVLAFGLLFTQIGAILDDDPNTTMDTEKLLGALAAIGGAMGLGLFSRDNDVTSEQAGAGK